MYEYPSGLKCHASKLRCEAYERIIPPIGMLLTLGGLWPAAYFFNPVNPLASLLLVSAIWVIWACFWAKLGFVVFNFWCKPEKRTNTTLDDQGKR